MRSDLPPLELLLHVITARGALSWSAWREAYESVAGTADERLGLPSGQASRLLDNLGHIEVASTNNELRLAAAPAMLSRLPRLGLPTAILSGGRSPQTERKLCEAADANAARVVVVPSAAERWRPPRSFLVEAENGARLAATAEQVGVGYAETPPAWSLANLAGDVDSYLAALRWRHEPEPKMSALEFGADTLRFGPVLGERAGFRLLRYFPRKLPSYFELRDGEKAARVDRDWGIYALLHGHGRNCLIYDFHGGLVAVPGSAPLPRILGRALSLCTGLAPAWLPEKDAKWKLSEKNGYHVYSGVPRSIADLIFFKLGQAPLPLHTPPQFLALLNAHRSL